VYDRDVAQLTARLEPNCMKTSARSQRCRKALTGFTLIELMIVVAIIGILASLALPAFRTVVFRSKTAEVSSNLNAMFKSAASYYANEHAAQGQNGTMVSHCTVSNAGPLPVTPGVQKQRMPNTDPEFRALGFSIADYVYYGYGLATDGVTGACGGTSNDNTIYTLYANGDLDGDNFTSTFELAVGSSDDNELYHARGLSIVNELE
jgi:prepilin-type N-terminal cleavage/methylation domain-containing protein